MSRSSGRIAYLVASTIAALAALTASASAEVPPLTRVQAQVTYHGDEYSPAGVRLHIRRNGVEVVDRPPPRLCPVGCVLQPVPKAFPVPAAKVLQLDRGPEPEVLFTMYSGGAHCCVFGLVFRWDEQLQRYTAASHGFLDSGYVLEDLRHVGTPQFVGRDNRFAYRFTCYACSRDPIQIWEYESGRFVDATRSFPGEVRRDLAEANRFYRRARRRGDVRGILATIVADRCLLGDCGAGFRTVRRALRAGELTPADPAGEFGPQGRDYLRVLRRFLDRLGYL